MNISDNERPLRVLGEAVAACAKVLPLVVTGAEWTSETLTIWGDSWSFSTMSSWRLSVANRLVASSLEQPEDASTRLSGVSLVRVDVREGAAADDPVLVFAGELVLEVFGDLTTEPWVLRLPGATYVPSNIFESST